MGKKQQLYYSGVCDALTAWHSVAGLNIYDTGLDLEGIKEYAKFDGRDDILALFED